MKPFWITTSWDDGHALDQRIADYLTAFHLTGTFYVARDYQADRLSEPQIAALAAQHEIGAHTISHPDLTTLNTSTLQWELSESRRWLESIVHTPVTSFCYPRGHYNDTVRQAVAAAGYEMARTTEAYRLEQPSDRFCVPTTIHVYPFPLRPVNSLRARTEPIRRSIPAALRLKLPIGVLRNWSSLALSLLDRAAELGGVWHLWGHSWEIERYQMWSELERVLSIAATYPQARAVTNGQLVRELSASTTPM